MFSMNKVMLLFLFTFLSIHPVFAQNKTAPIEDGLYEEFYPSGELRRLITYKDNQPDGPFNSFAKTGEKVGEGAFVNGELSGKAIGYHLNGIPSTEMYYKNGLLHGPAKAYADDGTLLKESNYRDGYLSGVYREYYRTGQLHYERKHKKGKVVGEAKEYSRQGHLLRTANFVNDVQTGIIREYDAEGNFMRAFEAEDGMVSGARREYYPSGRVQIEKWINPKESKNGYFKEFYESGPIWREVNLSGDLPHGLYQEYYEDGYLRASGHFVKGKRDGMFNLYYKDGKVKRKESYKNDELMFEADYDEYGNILASDNGEKE